MKRKSKVSKGKAKKAVSKAQARKAVAEVAKVSGFVKMDAEFESDWMAECGKERGESWMKPDMGMSAKNVCEVRMLDGTVVAPCYLDGDMYARVDGEASIPLKEVEAVRCYVEALERREEEDEDSCSDEIEELRDMMEDEG